ncbi:MAG TPA: asparagine synthase-related protein [Candidatus Acidoferrales bacterium]|jgi:asparagine synthase (glutamine-hydrolysing)|nr:asparagine synthase-related protein [Candidatus Acidoferrales bacterium]
MSGIIGILHLDGAPVDRRLVQRLTESQTFRGPDAQEVWVSGNIGFGHTLLKTTEESEHERQPFTLGDDIWIVADARVDARRDLVAQLQAHGHKDLAAAPDVELILRAYSVWGEECLDHLLGDFAFGIWDGPRQKLFCARDQMGVKCFYYAQIGSCVIFSNTLDCIRQHPAVSDRLNDLAIADFLLFEMNLDQATTSFADIHRLPPAHKGVWSHEGLRQSRYWTMPIEEPVFYKRAADYTDRFMELLKEAVSDRLRTRRVGILMSGGLDSPALAAVACKLSRERTPQIAVRAVTKTAAHGPDEKYYAEMVARHLQIPIEFYDFEAESGNPDWEQSRLRTSQPVANVSSLTTRTMYWSHMATGGRVFLQGEGPDNALSIDWKPYVLYLVRRRRYGRLLYDGGLYLAWHRRIPFWGKISRAFHKAESGGSAGPTFPKWMNKNLETRLALRARWENYYSPPPSVHPVRPLNYALLSIPGEFQELFRSHDAESTRATVEVRYPFMDLRMLRYFLVVPSIPWCRSKYLLRRAMKGLLPDLVLHRPKGGVAVSMNIGCLGRGGLVPLRLAPGFDSYIDPELLPNATNEDPWASGSVLSARLLNHWLQNSYHNGHNAAEEVVSK